MYFEILKFHFHWLIHNLKNNIYAYITIIYHHFYFFQPNMYFVRHLI